MRRLKGIGRWIFKGLERAGEWCLERLPYYICYGAVVLAVVMIFVQLGIHKGRKLQRAEVSRLQTEVTVLKGGLGELTGLLQDKCMAVWRGEGGGYETVSRTQK